MQSSGYLAQCKNPKMNVRWETSMLERIIEYCTLLFDTVRQRTKLDFSPGRVCKDKEFLISHEHQKRFCEKLQTPEKPNTKDFWRIQMKKKILFSLILILTLIMGMSGSFANASVEP